ncbi:MAG: hypothetical protein ABT11_19815 [Novosphingobium sp. SCN 66-18]|nr:MAG: hypothetical protein ABT11_19815 [Novosphingobium sp. SCN 66-18]
MAAHSLNLVAIMRPDEGVTAMERNHDEQIEDLGTASVETLGLPGVQNEFGIQGRVAGIEAE